MLRFLCGFVLNQVGIMRRVVRAYGYKADLLGDGWGHSTLLRGKLDGLYLRKSKVVLEPWCFRKEYPSNLCDVMLYWLKLAC